jgi:DNA-directed RNA polymerase subunit beta
VNEEVGRYKREKFNISIGDELPAGVLKLAKFICQEAQTESRR